MPETADLDAARTMLWRDDQAIVNLRGHPEDDRFVQATQQVLGIAPPLEPCRTVAGGGLRIVWAGPDDWFVIAEDGAAGTWCRRLREALAGVHAAVTDVSSGYAVLQLSGPSARERLAQGCPLDLHPRAFGAGCAADTHWFKASVWLWRPDDEPRFELLVRRSFRGYVASMLARAAA